MRFFATKLTFQLIIILKISQIYFTPDFTFKQRGLCHDQMNTVPHKAKLSSSFTEKLATV